MRLFLHYGDLTDASSLAAIVGEVKPDEIYNLGAQSHVRVSFDIPEYTGDVTALGAVRLLEAIRERGVRCRFYQACSSELFGKVVETPQSETTPFHPRSPYAAAKAYAYYVTLKLPRGVRHLRVQRHPLQPREPAPRRDLRHPQDHPRGRPHQARPAEEALPRQPRRRSATGATRATTSRPCG